MAGNVKIFCILGWYPYGVLSDKHPSLKLWNSCH